MLLLKTPSVQAGLRTIDIPARVVLHAGQPIHAAAGGHAQQKGLCLVACAIPHSRIAQLPWY